MSRGFFNREAHSWIIGIVLMALAVRALIPAGFMPSAEQPFTLQICPEGFPSQLLDRRHGFHHEHSEGHDHAPRDSLGGTHRHDLSRSEHCVFAAAAGIGPAPHAEVLAAWVEAATASSVPPQSPPLGVQRFRTPQPRAPPSLA
jgi:hypothetical protein